MIIPTQLKDCRFCKIKRGEKGPYEKNWQNKVISYEIISEYFPRLNYGILCGHDELGVIDDDTEDKILMKLYEDNFPETFQVRGHYYIKIKGWDCRKIIFYDGEEHLGELQGIGTQVVGAGSLHPSGEIYELIKDIPIVEIEFKEFEKAFGKYMKKKIQKLITLPSTSWDGGNINNIPVQNVMSPVSTEHSKNPCQGSHPIHGSETGNNFAISPVDNTWYCFRCQSGGGIWSAIAVSEGIISCSDAKGYTFSDSQKKDIVKIAHDKYGLEFPENEKGKQFEMLKKSCTKELKGYECLNCSKDLFFNGNIVYCKKCGYIRSFKNHMREKVRMTKQ